MCERIDSSAVTSCVLCKKLRCLREERRIAGFAQLDRGGHEAAATPRGAPAVRVRELGDQTVRVKAKEDTADLGALATGVEVA